MGLVRRSIAVIIALWVMSWVTPVLSAEAPPQKTVSRRLSGTALLKLQAHALQTTAHLFNNAHGDDGKLLDAVHRKLGAYAHHIEADAPADERPVRTRQIEALKILSGTFRGTDAEDTALRAAARDKLGKLGEHSYELALGLRMRVLNPKQSTLQTFAARRGALTYLDFSLPPGMFAPAFTQVIKRADHIHFDLTGLDLQRAFREAPSLPSPGTMTNWELATLRSSWGELGHRVTFWRDGQVVSPPWSSGGP